MKKYPYNKEETTVKVAEDWITTFAREGAECPCCGQFVKVYRRKLYASMAYALILLAKMPRPGVRDGFYHMPSLLDGHGTVARGGDFAKLVHWDLLEAHERNSGYYRVSEKGRQFVECRIAVPVAVFIYDGARIDWDTSEMVTIADALGDKFDYDELMELEN